MSTTKEKLKRLIKEEIEKLLAEQDQGLTPQQKEVMRAFRELTEKVEDMGESHPDMTDAYVELFRALKYAGVRVDIVAMHYV